MNTFTLKSWLTLVLWSSLLLLGDECLTPAAPFNQACLTQSVISLWLLSNQRTPLSLAFLLMSLQRWAEPASAIARGVNFIKRCDAARADESYLNFHRNPEKEVIRPPNHVLPFSLPILTFIPLNWLFSKTLSLRATAGNPPLQIRKEILILPVVALDASRWCSIRAKLRTFSKSQIEDGSEDPRFKPGKGSSQGRMTLCFKLMHRNSTILSHQSSESLCSPHGACTCSECTILETTIVVFFWRLVTVQPLICPILPLHFLS